MRSEDCTATLQENGYAVFKKTRRLSEEAEVNFAQFLSLKTKWLADERAATPKYWEPIFGSGGMRFQPGAPNFLGDNMSEEDMKELQAPVTAVLERVYGEGAEETQSTPHNPIVTKAGCTIQDAHGDWKKSLLKPL